MEEREEQFTATVAELANALQVAAPLADRLRVTAAQQHADAAALDGAIDRAVRALRTFQPGGKKGTDDGDR
jgi:hypothetical protein